ncbi:MAG: formylglycine-generating enzyme family protein [Gemmataceae bacterium]|nr:formylglycine-generating enzyme family protein [Gemmataceae bacterium]
MKRNGAMVLLLVGLAAHAVVGSQQDEKKLPDPTPRKADILRRFVADFVLLTPGQGKFPAKFLMGSKAAREELPIHEVAFAYSFAVNKYEVTQELYHVVMGYNPSKWKGLRNAVEVVSWAEANEFCDKATKELRALKLLGDKERIRLLTEAEWEYACRAGTTTAWSHGDSLEELGKYCWYSANSAGFDPPVGEKAANPWGLFDMHGYNWEWVADDWAPDYQGAPTDGSARRVPKAKERVIRGGSWNDSADAARCAARGRAPAETRNDKIGFRCAKAADGP